MLELEEAQTRILAHLQALTGEIIPLAEADGRFSAENINASIDLPTFDNSAMDGYAVQSKDLISTSVDSPLPLCLTGKVAAGETFSGATLVSGACVRVFTGSPLPCGADAVVMQEDTRIDSADPKKIWVMDAVKPWENVRFRGEDVKRDSTILSKGDRLTVGRISLLAALGVKNIKVSRQPIVGLLATGSELIEAGQPLPPGKIYESNRVGLATLVARAGATAKVYPLVPDDLLATTEALEKAFAECDIVITSGGVSVGEYDFVKAAFEKLNGEFSFWKVAIRPGKPFVFGTRQGKLLCGLPGNPVSALVTFLLLVRPALLCLQGAADWKLHTQAAVLGETLRNDGDRRHFVRVMIDEKGEVRSTGVQASHMLSSLAMATGLVDLPPKAALPSGTLVKVLKFD